MRPLMRFRVLLTSLLLLPSVARADLTTRALDQAQSGGSAPTPPAQLAGVDNDLTTWAGTPQPTSLPELLQAAVRLAPALASAKLDIEIAEAQIQETWVRNDWVFDATAS